MRMFSKLLAAAAGAATVAALVVAPAMADPINPVSGKAVEPRACDVVGSGSNTTQPLVNQISVDYNTPIVKAHPGSQTESCSKFPTAFFYTWDALQNAAATSSPMITTKAGCAKIERPNGSSAGITALATDEGGTTHHHPCLDYARSSRAPKTTDPPGLTFVALAQDNLTYASIKKSTKFPHGSNAPTNLTTKDLTNIYLCKVTTWNQVGGTSHATIRPLLPQMGSGTLAQFLADIGVTTPGPCVDEPATLEENEGIDPIYKSANAPNEIVPFSAGRWVAQQFRSAQCVTSACPTNKAGTVVLCKKPTASQNRFGCDVNGVLKLNRINGTSPTKGKALNPPKSAANPTGYTDTFVRTLYSVVRGTKIIPKYLRAWFGPKSFICRHESTAVSHYGFEPAHIPGFPQCGTLTAG
jgi:ABC-type phosphate transport system substrate-binding protein